MIIWYLFAIVWISRIVLNFLSYIQLWFVKEYRFDRMFIHLRTSQGKRLLLIPFKRPPLSPRTIFVFVSSIVVSAAFLIFSPGFILVKVAILDIFSFPVVAIFVFISRLPTFAYHQILIRRAITGLVRHKKMKVIAVTGSYGKTTTKEILYSLLSQKYKTIKTEASKNSPIAIAEVVLSQLRPEHEIFIVEMGAYKTGEIKKMSSMVHPHIAVLTAINVQHQDLFGSIEMTMKAKYELVQGLEPGGKVIANADNEYIRTMCEWAKHDGRTVNYYSTADPKALLFAKHIHSTREGISFTAVYKSKKADLAIRLFGTHQVGNVLAAMAAAIECGMGFEEVAKATSFIVPLRKTMYPAPGIKGATFIDDTFNNNPDAAKAALDYLEEQPQRKIFVFQPMIELGRFEEASHREVGAVAARVCDEIILTNDNFYDSFMSGVKSVRPTMKVPVLNGKKGAEYLNTIIQKGDSVLYKGKESARILDYLRQKGRER